MYCFGVGTASPQAVSWAKAEQTGVWYVGDTREPQRPAAFDADLIEKLVAAVDEAERGWASFANDIAVDRLEMTYEELAADPIVAGKLVLRFLDVPTSVELAVQTKPQSDRTNSEWIARYERERGGFKRHS